MEPGRNNRTDMVDLERASVSKRFDYHYLHVSHINDLYNDLYTSTRVRISVYHCHYQHAHNRHPHSHCRFTTIVYCHYYYQFLLSLSSLEEYSIKFHHCYSWCCHHCRHHDRSSVVAAARVVVAVGTKVAAEHD